MRHNAGASPIRVEVQLGLDAHGASALCVHERTGRSEDAGGLRKFFTRLGVAAMFPFGVHLHMLRHACGYKLTNDGRDTRALQHYLGHKNIMHTVRYTELSAERFKNFWED